MARKDCNFNMTKPDLSFTCNLKAEAFKPKIKNKKIQQKKRAKRRAS